MTAAWTRESYEATCRWAPTDALRQKLEDVPDACGPLLGYQILAYAADHPEYGWDDETGQKVLTFLAAVDPKRHEEVITALPGVRGAEIERGAGGKVIRWVRLDPRRLDLVTTRYDEVSHIVPGPFLPRKFLDSGSGEYYEWARPGSVVRARRDEFLDLIRREYRPTSPQTHALAIYLDRLPPSGEVSTNLVIRGPKNRHGAAVGFWVPRVFGRVVGDRADAATLLGRWYRPRTREVALRRLDRLRQFAATPKLLLVLLYIAGAPLHRKFAASRPLPNLDLEGESRTGKTTWTKACIAVIWGLGEGNNENLGDDAVGSAFRRESFLSATDFPLLVDEALLSRDQRRSFRSAAGGAQSTRAGRDLLHQAYVPKAPVIFTTNVPSDESDSSASELHGDQRRRLRILFEPADRAAIDAERSNFESMLKEIGTDPLADWDTDETAGGAGLHLLNDRTSRGEDLAVAERLVASSDGEVELVLHLGAWLLGVPEGDIPAPDRPTEDQAGEAFLDFIRTEAGRWIATKHDTYEGSVRRAADPLLQRIRVMRDLDGELEAIADEDARYVYVTYGELQEYRRFRRAAGGASPFSTLPSLRALSPLTGQAPDEISPTRSGHVRRVVRGAPGAKAAVVRLPQPGKELPSDG